MVRDGSVAYELLRPLNLYGIWFARQVAARSAPTLLRSVPLAIVALALLGMRPPPTWASAGAFAVALLGALLLSSAFTALVSATMMWTVAGDGMARLVPALALLATGIIVPLPLYPEWAQRLFALLPFRSMADVPFRIYTGHIAPDRALVELACQSAWLVALIALGSAVTARGVRRLVVQGG